jgi:hypothetical protein
VIAHKIADGGDVYDMIDNVFPAQSSTRARSQASP